jgi:hypothetical protein
MSNWEKRESTTHPFREYYLNTSTQVSQWGIPEGEIPLPPDWERHRSRQFNKIYYENLKTSQTQWEPPFGRILPFILFGDDPDPYHVLDNLDSNWKYGIFITPIFTDEEVYIKKVIQDPQPWGELNIPCTQFISINSEKAKLCLQKIMSINNPINLKIEFDPQGEEDIVVTHYEDYSPNVNNLFDYFSDNFIVGNKYEKIDMSNPNPKEIYEYLGRETCKFIEENGHPYIFNSDSVIRESEIEHIKYTECHIFNTEDGIQKISVSDARNLGRIRPIIHIPIDLSSLSNIDKEDIKKIEQSSINILKKLFIETYYNLSEKQANFFRKISRAIDSFNFKLKYINRDNNTFIEKDSKEARIDINRNLLLDLCTSPKAESDFYVFRASKHGNDVKILSGEVTEQKMYGAISTTILSEFSKKWLVNNTCCIYLIRVPKNENYLILDDVFIKNNYELELNNKSQYEVTLAPGRIIFTNMKKITIDGSEKMLFVCDYKSFTEKEFNDGFDGPIYEYDLTRQILQPAKEHLQEIDINKLNREEQKILVKDKFVLARYKKYFEGKIEKDKNFEDKIEKDKNFEYALEELKKTEWEYSFIARLDEKEKNTRSLIFISKTLGIRAYVRNINQE